MPLGDIGVDEKGNQVITLVTEWNAKELVKKVSGCKWLPNKKIWAVPPTWASLVTLRGVFKETFTLTPALIDWAWVLRRERIDPALEVRSLLEWPAIPGLDEHLYSYQRAGVEFMRRAKSGLLGDDMGTGKSLQTLALNLAHEHERKNALPALIICPNSVKRHWVNEVSRWMPTAHVYNIEGTAAKKRKLLKEAKNNPHCIVLMNIESVKGFTRLAPYGSTRLKRCTVCDPKHGDVGLTTARCEVHIKELNEFKFVTVTLDEAHRVKNPAALQTRAIWQMMHQPGVEYRWALTGTPIANHPGDLWSIMHAVAPEDFPTKSQFVDRYCLAAWNAFGKLDIIGINPDTRDELFKLLDPRFRRMLKAVVLPQLPPKVRQTRYVDMSNTQAKMYGELKSRLITRTPDGDLFIAPSNLEASLRLMQVASSSVKMNKRDPDDITQWDVVLSEPSPKLDALEEVLEEKGILSQSYAGAPVIIAAEFKQLINLATKRLDKLGVRYALITGDVSPVERERALDALQKRQIKVLLFTNAAGGVGLNMTAADTLINLQRSWSLVAEVQKESRNHRIGSEIHDSITIIDIVMKDTVEEDQITKLHDKFMRLDEITRDRAALVAANPQADTSVLDAQEALILNTPLASIPYVGVNE
jgi:SNF2 family DNA or RNA helicase